MSTLHTFSHIVWKQYNEVHYIIILFILHLGNLKHYIENEWIVPGYTGGLWSWGWIPGREIQELHGWLSPWCSYKSGRRFESHLCLLVPMWLQGNHLNSINQMKLIITHLGDVLWETNELVFRLFCHFFLEDGGCFACLYFMTFILGNVM